MAWQVLTGLAVELEGLGLQVMTSGNHIWDKPEIFPFIEEHRTLLRPHNYPRGAPGTGVHLGTTSAGVGVAVVNLMGRVFMSALDCPFRLADRILEEIRDRCRVVLVDFHAEATSEKVALGWYLDGRVSTVIGTHTHVQTADEQIFSGGTAFLCDAGFTGPHDGVIGRTSEPIIKRFMTNMPQKFEVAEGRVLLADALAFLGERRPGVILDSATLTDASGLGPDLWAAMGTDRDAVMELVEAGREAGDAGWEIPL